MSSWTFAEKCPIPSWYEKSSKPDRTSGHRTLVFIKCGMFFCRRMLPIWPRRCEKSRRRVDCRRSSRSARIFLISSGCNRYYEKCCKEEGEGCLLVWIGCGKNSRVTLRRLIRSVRPKKESDNS